MPQKISTDKKTRWTPEQDNLLKKLYYDADKEILLNTFNKSYDAIKLHAAKLNLKRSLKFQRENDLTNLISGSYESLYWLGFLMADGCFKNNKRIYLSVAIKDLKHIQKFANFIKCNNISIFKKENKEYCKISAQNVELVPILINKYNISNNKTIYPCNLTTLNKEELLCLLIGFIDGDGSINVRHNKKSFYGQIKCHSAWLDNFLYIRQKLNLEGSFPKINKAGYVSWTLSMKQLRHLKQEALKHNLPAMERKWSIVSDYTDDKFYLPIESIKKFKDLNNGGLSQRKIANQFNINRNELRSALNNQGKYKSIVYE